MCFAQGHHAQIQKIFSVEVQIPRRGLTENFNRGGPNSQKGSDGKFQHGDLQNP